MRRTFPVGAVGPGTLREELNRRGYTDHNADDAQYRREIRRGSKRVALFSADRGWNWLARLDAKLAALRGAR